MSCNADPLSTIESPAHVWRQREYHSIPETCLYMVLSILLNVTVRPLGWLLTGVDFLHRKVTGWR